MELFSPPPPRSDTSELAPVSGSTCDCEDAHIAKTLLGSETKRLRAARAALEPSPLPSRLLPVLPSSPSLNPRGHFPPWLH